VILDDNKPETLRRRPYELSYFHDVSQHPAPPPPPSPETRVLHLVGAGSRVFSPRIRPFSSVAESAPTNQQIFSTNIRRHRKCYQIFVLQRCIRARTREKERKRERERERVREIEEREKITI